MKNKVASKIIAASMAAAMVGGVVPPLGVALATTLFKKKVGMTPIQFRNSSTLFS